MAFNSIGIIGAGAWGTALGQTMRLAGRAVLIWAREAEVVAEIETSHTNSAFLPGVALDPALRATPTLADVAACDVVLMVAPAQHVRAVAAELATLPNVRVMSRTTVVGAYDGGTYGALERVAEHVAEAGRAPRQCFWRIVAKRAVLAAGAIERLVAFPGNDRPGVMLAGAVRAYLNRWAVAPRRAVVFATGSSTQSSRGKTQRRSSNRASTSRRPSRSISATRICGCSVGRSIRWSSSFTIACSRSRRAMKSNT